MDNKALIILDVQSDYFTGGKMALYKSMSIILIINRMKMKFKHVFFVKDWYSAKHKSFKKNGGNNPSHCTQYTPGSKLHKFLKIDHTEHIIKKGTNNNYKSHSAFYDAKCIGEQTVLNYHLYDLGIDTVYVCGLNEENSVFHTILDAYKFRYKCYYVYDACMGRDDDKIIKCRKFLKKIGIKYIKSDQI